MVVLVEVLVLQQVLGHQVVELETLQAHLQVKEIMVAQVELTQQYIVVLVVVEVLVLLV